MGKKGNRECILLYILRVPTVCTYILLYLELRGVSIISLKLRGRGCLLSLVTHGKSRKLSESAHPLELNNARGKRRYRQEKTA